MKSFNSTVITNTCLICSTGCVLLRFCPFVFDLNRLSANGNVKCDTQISLARRYCLYVFIDGG